MAHHCQEYLFALYECVTKLTIIVHMNLFGYVGGILNFFIIAFAAYVTRSFGGTQESAGSLVEKIQIVRLPF